MDYGTGRPLRTCTDCNEPTQTLTKEGLCHKCYKQQRTAKCVKCELEKIIYAKKMCRNCYHAAATTPDCTECGQPTKERRRGLCEKCYIRHYQQRMAICMRCGSNTRIAARGMCGTCYRSADWDELQDWIDNNGQTLAALEDRFFLKSSMRDPRFDDLVKSDRERLPFAVPPYTKTVCSRVQKGHVSQLASLPQIPHRNLAGDVEMALEVYLKKHSQTLNDVQTPEDEFKSDEEEMKLAILSRSRGQRGMITAQKAKVAMITSAFAKNWRRFKCPLSAVIGSLSPSYIVSNWKMR